LKTILYRKNPLDDPEIEARMTETMRELMRANEAPSEKFERIGMKQ
jgi:hypothetical protein